MPNQPHTPPPHDHQTPAGLADAAYNAVAVASIAHREALDAADREQATFATVLTCAHRHGLTLTDLCTASGLDEPSVTRLLGEAS